MPNLAQATWLALLAKAFRPLYNEMAWAYDAVSQAASAGEPHGWQLTEGRTLVLATDAG